MTTPTCLMCAAPYCDDSLVLDLGDQPVGSHWPAPDEATDDLLAPLAMWCCPDCGLTQLKSEGVDRAEVVGVEPAAVVAEARRLVLETARRGHLPPTGRVREFGSPHGGSWLSDLTEQGLAAVSEGSAEVVVNSLGFMHRSDQADAFAELKATIAPGGVGLVFITSLAATVAHRRWNDLRPGHYAYYCLPVLTHLLESSGLCPIDAIASPLYGRSLLVVVRHRDDPRAHASEEFDAVLAEEQQARLTEPAVVRAALHDSVQASATALHDYLARARDAQRTVWGWAAASRAVTVLAVAQIGPELLPAIADLSPAKQGRSVPVSRIPICSPMQLLTADPDEILVFVPELVPEIAAAYPELADRLVPYQPGAPVVGAGTVPTCLDDAP